MHRIALTAAGFLLAAVSLTTSAAPTQDTLKKVKDTGVLTIGVRSSSIPFSYMNGDKAVGFSIDLCNLVAEKIKADLSLTKLEVKQLEVTSATRLPLLAAGATDLDCGSTTNTAERGRTVAFSVTTFLAGTRFLVKKDAGFKSAADLKGKTIAVTAGSNSIAKMNDLNKAQDWKLVLVNGKDHAESMSLLESGRVVAFAEDDVLLASLSATSRTPDAFVQLGVESLSADPYGLALRKDDPAFKKLVDGALRTAFTSGQFQQLYEKWFQKSIEGRNVNLNIPMSDRLKKAVRNPSDSPDPAAYK